MSHGNANSLTSLTGRNGELLECSKAETNGASATDRVLPVRIDGGPGVRGREPVKKKLGTSSTAFIGPVCCPPKAVQRAPKPPKVRKLAKPNIEETLSEFYKELEEIDPKDSVDSSTAKNEGSVELLTAHNPPPAREGSNASHGHKQLNHVPCPHWYDNEPYQPRRPIPRGPSYGPYSDHNHWQPPPPFHSQPYYRFHRPPHRFPPPPPIPCLPPPPPADHRYHPQREGSQQVPPFHRFPVPDGYRNSPDLDGHGFPPQHSNNRDRGGYGWRDDKYDQQGNDQQGSSEWQQRFDQGPEPPQPEDQHQPPEDKTYDYDPSLVLILMRGAPGSGKSTLARELLSTGSSGQVLSTDDYFSQEEGYTYDPSLLGAAHHWNQNRAQEAMYKCCSPVIIDNTNMQAWEMKPYVKLALERGYSINFHEPHTSWKFDPVELEKRNKHSVSREKIGQMLERFELPMSLDIVMNSQEPFRPTRHPSQQQRHSRANHSDFD
ncbi:NEDD4-binding protein 2-like 2 [Salvelinus sp. IW2-2015]|uniref:NEDD4-binding protein 2-like 2 n=1 Tax=Salvelinus sp. IW2-2015 TaxID=2691554 RepID=UPI000CDFA523|nr:NEDD4-binding protein 2-like 2 [Salvelinus alpinus]